MRAEAIHPLAFDGSTRQQEAGTFLTSPFGLFTSACLGLLGVVSIGAWENSLAGTLAVALFLLASGTFIVWAEAGFARQGLALAPLFWVTFGLRIAITAATHIWLTGVYTLPTWHMAEDGGDEIGFFDRSEHWLSAWLGGYILEEPMWPEETDHAAWTFSMGFVRFLGVLLGGDTLFNTKLLTCFFGSLVVPYVYLAARRLFDSEIARRAALLAFLLPDYFYLSSTTLRDVMNSCVLLIVMYQVIIGTSGALRPHRLVVALLLNIFVLHYLKVWLAETVLVLSALCWSHVRFKKRMSPVLLIWIFALLTFPLYASRLTQVMQYEVGRVFSVGDNLELSDRILIQRDIGLDEARSGSLGKGILERGVFVSSPVLAAQLLLSIPPWWGLKEGVSPRGIAETLASVIWLAFVVFLPAGLLESWRREGVRSSAWIWGTALTFIWLLAVSGTIILRWRLLVMPFLLILVAIGMSSQTYRWTVRWSIVTVIGLLIVYILLKGGF